MGNNVLALGFLVLAFVFAFLGFWTPAHFQCFGSAFLLTILAIACSGEDESDGD